MAVQLAAGGTSLIDVLDRVLDKGIVIDAWVRVSLVGIDLITVEARVVVASIDTYLKYSDGTSLRFGSSASSRSALQRGEDDDDDDGGPGGSESGGAPTALEYPLKPRLRQASSRERTRRRSNAETSHSIDAAVDMPNSSARILGEELADAVVVRTKEHLTWAMELGPTQLRSRNDTPDSRFDRGDRPALSDELQFLSAFIAAHVVSVAFAANPDYRSDVLREFRTHYLALQDDEDRSGYRVLLDDRFSRYERALGTRRPDEREDDVLANALAEVCGITGYEFYSAASDLIAQELIVMNGVIPRP
jgi:hypothetical protein